MKPQVRQPVQELAKPLVWQLVKPQLAQPQLPAQAWQLVKLRQRARVLQPQLPLAQQLVLALLLRQLEPSQLAKAQLLARVWPLAHLQLEQLLGVST